jgi:hypothetical protein
MARRGRAALAAFVGSSVLGALPCPVAAQDAGPSAGEAVAWPAAPLRLHVSIDVPEEGALVGDPGGMGFISGQALAAHGELETFDLMFVLDQSESTAESAGSDVDGDGEVGGRICEGALAWLESLDALLGKCRPSNADTVLSAELQAVRTLLGQLDPRATQIGVVTFSGDGDSSTPDAYVAVPLTSDYAQVERALEAIEKEGALGHTNMLAGVQLATLELVGAGRAYSTPRRGARKIAMLLSDGLPTLPILESLDENRRLTIAAAATAREFGIRFDVYGIGADALSEPEVLLEIARATSGTFSAVLYPRDLQSVFEQISFSELDELRIINRSTRRPAEYVLHNSDGTFSALVQMAEGENAIEVYARSSDGVQQTHTRRVRFLADAPVAELAPRLRAQRNRLMENHLADLRSRRLAVEALRDEEVRDEIRTRIDEGRESGDPDERKRDVNVEPPAPDTPLEPLEPQPELRPLR